MKKILNISALLMLLLLAATSCFKLEEDDIFDKTAAERLDEAAENYAKILTDKGGWWQMEYYANEAMKGFTYVMKFNADGTVTVAGNNEYIAALDPANKGKTAEPQYGKSTSQWEMLTDNGPVISFNTYNDVFHVFSRPDDFLGTTTVAGAVTSDGRGMEGDYEFTILRYNGNDSLYVQGKKHNLAMVLTRLDASTTDDDVKTYLQHVADENKAYFSSLIPRLFLTYPNGQRFVIQNASSLVMSLYDETVEDPLTSSFSANGIIGNNFFAFMNPLEHEGYKVRRFTKQENGMLLCNDDNTTTISAGDLARDCFADTLHRIRPKSVIPEVARGENLPDAPVKGSYWELQTNKLTGDVKAAYDELDAQLPKRGSWKVKVNAIRFNYVGWPLNEYEVAVIIGVSSSSKQYMKFYYKPEFTGAHQMKLTYIDHDGSTGTTAYYDNYSGLRNLISSFMQTYQLSSVSMLAPTTITFTNTTNSSNSFAVSVGTAW